MLKTIDQYKLDEILKEQIESGNQAIEKWDSMGMPKTFFPKLRQFIKLMTPDEVQDYPLGTSVLDSVFREIMGYKVERY